MCRWDIHRKHAWRREKMFISILKTAKTSNMSITTLRQENHLNVSLSFDGSEPFVVSFERTKELYNLECFRPANMTYELNHYTKCQNLHPFCFPNVLRIHQKSSEVLNRKWVFPLERNITIFWINCRMVEYLEGQINLQGYREKKFSLGTNYQTETCRRNSILYQNCCMDGGSWENED